MRFSTLILAIPAVLVAATPAAEIKEPRAGSGCYVLLVTYKYLSYITINTN